MAILKIINEGYRNTNAIDKLVNYVLNPNKMPSKCYGGNGISLYTPTDSMNVIKKVYGKTTGRQAVHFILAFTRKEISSVPPSLLKMLGDNICTFFRDVQVLYSLHEYSDQYGDFIADGIHFHFVINPVNYTTGKKFGIDYSNSNALKTFILQLLKEYFISNTLFLVV